MVEILIRKEHLNNSYEEPKGYNLWKQYRRKRVYQLLFTIALTSLGQNEAVGFGFFLYDKII